MTESIKNGDTPVTHVTSPVTRANRGAVEGALSRTVTTEESREQTGMVVESLGGNTALSARRTVIGKIVAALADGEGETDKLSA